MSLQDFYYRLDSNVYEAGKTARVHVKVRNDSSVDIENFALKVKMSLSETDKLIVCTWVAVSISL